MFEKRPQILAFSRVTTDFHSTNCYPEGKIRVRSARSDTCQSKNLITLFHICEQMAQVVACQNRDSRPKNGTIRFGYRQDKFSQVTPSSRKSYHITSLKLSFHHVKACLLPCKSYHITR